MTADDSKKLGPFLATMIVAGGTIGSGIFVLPASLGSLGSITILSWLAATAGAALLAGVFAWLVIIDPDAPGLFSYIGNAFGPGAAFVAGALYWLECLVAAVAVALAATGYLSVFVPAVAHPPGLTIATIAATWILVAANMIGPRFVARLQSWTLLFGLAPVILVALGGWFFFHGATFVASWNPGHESALSLVPRGTVMAFWAFLGIETAIVLAVRVRNPARDVPIGTLAGLGLAATIYILACSAIMGILPATALAKSSAPFADVTARILGATAASAVALCAMFKAWGTLGATVLTTVETGESRSVLGVLRRDAPPESASRASMANFLLTGVLASAIVIASVSPTLARQFTIVTDVAVVLSVAIYGGASLALLRLSSALPSNTRFWVRLLGTAAALFSAWLVAVSEYDLLIWSAGAALLASVVYIAFRSRRPPMPKAKEATS